MKYWEIIADKLSKSGWSLGGSQPWDSKRQTMGIVDAHHDDGKRFVVRAMERGLLCTRTKKLTAFVDWNQ